MNNEPKPPEGVTPNAAPVPTNRMVKSGMVKVRAVQHLHEDQHYNPGQEFETTEERARALGKLVEKAES